MTDRAKFEEMLERLIAEDNAGAEELFHEIVVEKSREIYSSILESEEEVEETTDEEVDESEDDDLDEATDEEVDESEEEVDEASDEDLDESDDEDLDEMFGLDEFEAEADPMGMDMGGDATDMLGDMEPEMDDEEGEEEAEGPEEAMSDLKDALAALEAEFEKMMGGEGDEEGDDDEEGEEEPEEEAYAFESEDEDLEEGGHSNQMIKDKENMSKAEFEKKYGDAAKDMDESKMSAGEIMREYANKIATPAGGDNGANAKSVVAGKNDMGGTAANIVAGDTEAGVEANKGNLKGAALSDQNAKEDNAGNRNKPGGTSAKTGMKNEPGHGAEKKGKPEQAANKKSTIGS